MNRCCRGGDCNEDRWELVWFVAMRATQRWSKRTESKVYVVGQWLRYSMSPGGVEKTASWERREHVLCELVVGYEAFVAYEKITRVLSWIPGLKWLYPQKEAKQKSWDADPRVEDFGGGSAIGSLGSIGNLSYYDISYYIQHYLGNKIVRIGATNGTRIALHDLVEYPLYFSPEVSRCSACKYWLVIRTPYSVHWAKVTCTRDCQRGTAHTLNAT